MEKISLVKTLAALRAELIEAIAIAEKEDIQFPVGSIQLEFQVGVTKNAEATGGVNFWVLELGASGSYANESVQKITINLEAPVDSEGKTVKVARHLQQKP